VAEQGNCTKFGPNADMLSRMTSANLYAKDTLTGVSVEESDDGVMTLLLNNF
jgi:hypothetical protein